jgi:hypothetical protein
MKSKYWIAAVMFVISFQSIAQKKEVAGIITSKDDRELLQGIVVWVKGSNQGLITGNDGYFDLTVSEGDTIEASSHHFKTMELIVGNGWHFEILLETNRKADERTGFLQSKTYGLNPGMKKQKTFQENKKIAKNK